MVDDTQSGVPTPAPAADGGNPAKEFMTAAECFDSESAVKATINLSIDVEQLNPKQVRKLLDFLATLDNSPAAAIGAGIGKK